jgi:hypothetical protein
MLYHYLYQPEGLEQFRDRHLGRCFIIATGPSLQKTNLSILKKEYILGVNSFYRHKLKCNYFFITDDVFWYKYSNDVLHKYGTKKAPLFLCIDEKPVRPYVYNVPRRPGPGSLHEFEPGFQLMPDRNGWGDMTLGVYRGHTVVAFAIQAAFFMGFDQICLLGCDCNYTEDGKHHFDGTKVDSYWRTDWSPVFDMYQICKEEAEKQNKTIINCTVGGNLEVFARVPLDTLLLHAQNPT